MIKRIHETHETQPQKLIITKNETFAQNKKEKNYWLGKCHQQKQSELTLIKGTCSCQILKERKSGIHSLWEWKLATLQNNDKEEEKQKQKRDPLMQKQNQSDPEELSNQKAIFFFLRFHGKADKNVCLDLQCWWAILSMKISQREREIL